MSLTAAYELGCGLDTGGLKTVHLANKADVTSMTLATSATNYDTITMNASAVFYKVDFESASWTKNDDNSTVLLVDLGKLSQTSRDFVQDVKDCGKCGVVAIVTDANDVSWVIGYDEKDGNDNPLISETAAGNTSTRGEDTENTLSFVRLKNKLEEERTFTGTIPVS
jgi:hypothetical protein